MLLGFFEHLRRYAVPVSIRELIDLLAIFDRRLLFADQDEFYFLSRLALVKDEKYYDRFDRAFASYFSGVDDWIGVFDTDSGDSLHELLAQVSPDLELHNTIERYLRGVKEQRESQQLNDQPGDADRNDPSEGNGEGDEGEGGDSGNEGDSGETGEGDEGKQGEGDEGERGDGRSQEAEEGERSEETDDPQRTASKVWLAREFQDYDPDVELGTRNLKMALRRLRRWVREASDLELDLPDTIRSTAANGGFLVIKEVPERHNAVKVLIFFDIGGSMDEHISLCEQLFSAVKTEFKHLEYFYFHNFLYESVWHENERRLDDKVPLSDVLQKYPRDYKVIFVGDADMGRHEIAERGGSVEHFNAEPGEVWMKRVQHNFRNVIWLNPVPEKRWCDSHSIQLVKRMLDDHMYFLSGKGLEMAMRYLMR